MKIQYNVLWFEDNTSFFDAIRKRLERHLAGSDLVLKCEQSKDGNKLSTLHQDSDLDLILIDYNLINVKGDELISKIRKKRLLTEIIFYSRDPDFKDSVAEGVEGLYFSNKSGLFSKTKYLIDKTARKVDHVSIQRGNFIADAIALESRMIDLLLKHYSITGKKGKKEFRERVCESEFFTTYQKYRLIRKALDDKLAFCKKRSYKKRFDKLSVLKDIFSKFQKEVIELRNKLAHVKIKSSGAVPQLVYGDGQIFKFDAKGIKDARKKLSKHMDNLDALGNYF